jgi:hypothetical protein
MIKATTLLLARHRRIQKLVDVAACEPSKRDDATNDLIEAIITHLATVETVLYPEIERELLLDMREHWAALVHARLALFRVATASPHTESYVSHLSWLDRVMRDHALREGGVVRILEDAMSEAKLQWIGARMVEFERALAARPAFTRRCEAALAS